jgi:hypothetical protein
MLPMPNPVMLPIPDWLIVPIPERLIVPTPDVVMLPMPGVPMLPTPDDGPALVPTPDAPAAGGRTPPVCRGRVGTDCTMMIALGALLRTNAPWQLPFSTRWSTCARAGLTPANSAAAAKSATFMGHLERSISRQVQEYNQRCQPPRLRAMRPAAQYVTVTLSRANRGDSERFER